MATSLIVALFIIFLLLFLIGCFIVENNSGLGVFLMLASFIGGVIALGGIGVRLFG